MFPPGYHLTLLRGDDGTPFHDPAEQERLWGRRWGAVDEVGRLRMVLVRRPLGEFGAVRADCWDEEAGALVDPDGLWYWESRESPDLDLVDAQHQALVDALGSEGVEVIELDGDLPPHITTPIYTRDPLVTVTGGAIIGRLEPYKRRGEEAAVARSIAALGMPILATIHGTGLLEGGSFAKLTPTVAAFGTSFRCNDEAAAQLAAALRPLGIELIVVPLSTYSIHIDGHLGMVAPDLALIDPLGLPWWFVDRLRALGIEAVPCVSGEEWAINSLALRPRRLLMCEGYPRTIERLERHGVEVVTVPYAEIPRAAAASTARRWSWCATRRNRKRQGAVATHAKSGEKLTTVAGVAVCAQDRDSARQAPAFTVTIDRYGHLFPGKESQAAELLDAYLESALRE